MTVRAANGVSVRIDTRYAAPRGSAEERAVIAEQRRAAHRILMERGRADAEARGKADTARGV